ncbi:putative hydrolase/acyltransferase [Lachnospiraceae bacterium KM106-2]|nr:putative hydrolase/acyltransferase [Lachnospiraceae bacterium KM106-2]
METKYVRKEDGSKISYSVCGQGEALLLLHGSGRSKEIWEQYGWVSDLKEYFTVIAMDIRGYGKSDKSHDPAFYSIDTILDDIKEVVSACGYTSFSYFGHSYGATIGLQAAKRGMKIQRMVLASGAIGDQFFQNEVPLWISEYKHLEKCKKMKNYEEFSKDEIAWIEENDIESYLAQFQNWLTWKGVLPSEITIPFAFYSGTNDGADTLEYLRNHKEEMDKQGIKVKIFEGLTHHDLIEKEKICFPFVKSYLLNE